MSANDTITALTAEPGDDDLDWSVFDDESRRAYLAELDDEQMARSTAIDRLVELAATVSRTRFAQLSVIDDTQYVPASFGIEYGADDQYSPRDDSLCSVTIAYGDTLQVDDAASHPWVRALPPVSSGMVGSYLGVPVTSESGVTVGAICAFEADARSWEPETRDGLEGLAELVAREIDLIQATGSRADTLRSLVEAVEGLTSFEPPLSSLPIVTRTQAASVTQMGGDWFDHRDIDDGRSVAFTVGDVAGHGLDAVATMAAVRTAYEAYLVEQHDAPTLLDRLNVLMSERQPGSMVTVIHGRFDRDRGSVSLVSAGHLPPLVVRDGRAEFAPVRPGPPLGMAFDRREHARGDSVPFAPTEIDVAEGDDLVLFSDGLVERRDEVIDDGLDALRTSVEEIWAATADPDERADRLMAWRRGTTDDDVCLMIVPL